MCGIAGYTTNSGAEFDERLKIALPILGLYMQERGKHSWGWTDGVNVHKEKGAFSGSFDGDLLGSKTALIHTRFGTVGAQTAENSHP